MLERYKGQPLNITITFPSNPLLVYNKDYVDVVDCVINLKKNTTTDLDADYLEKSLGGGVAIDEPNHKFILTLLSTDYTNLIEKDTYNIVLAVDLGFAEYVELKMSDSRLLITNDKNRA